MGARRGGGPEGWGPGGVGARTRKGGARRVGVRRVGGPKGWGPEGLGARRVGGPKFRAFFFSLPPEFHSFFLSLGGLLVEFWWCLKRRDAQSARLEFSGCRVKPRRPQSQPLRRASGAGPAGLVQRRAGPKEERRAVQGKGGPSQGAPVEADKEGPKREKKGAQNVV